MKEKCSICNNNFILTEGGDVISNLNDLYAKWPDCYNCSLEVKSSCEAILNLLPKQQKEEISVDTFCEKMNLKFNHNKKGTKKH